MYNLLFSTYNSLRKKNKNKNLDPGKDIKGKGYIGEI